MSEYEFDENGGHKPIDKGNGRKSIPTLGCGKCEAAFFNADAREKHLREKHPFNNYGAHWEAIQLARIRPDVPEFGKMLGLWRGTAEEGLEGWKEEDSPINVPEFLEREGRKDRLSEISDRKDEIQSHPAYKYVQELKSHLNQMVAVARQSTTSDRENEDIANSRDDAEYHINNLAAYHTIGKSVDEERSHAAWLENHVNNIAAYYDDEDLAESHENHVYDLLNDLVEHGIHG